MQKIGRFMAVRTYQNLNESTRAASRYSKTGKTKPDRFTKMPETSSPLKSIASKVKNLFKKTKIPKT